MNNKKAYKVILCVVLVLVTKLIWNNSMKENTEINIEKDQSTKELKEPKEATSYKNEREPVIVDTLANSVQDLDNKLRYCQVKGFVFDKNGNPAPFSEIEFRPIGLLNNLQSVFSYTNRDGEYIRDIIPGQYEIYCYNITKSLTESVIIDTINVTNNNVFYYDIYLPNGHELTGVIDMQLSFFKEVGDTPYEIQIYLYGNERPIYSGITEFPGDNEDYKPGRFKVENLYPGQYTLRVSVGESEQKVIYFEKPFSISSSDYNIGQVIINESSLKIKYN